jgi:hypothetical protein
MDCYFAIREVENRFWVVSFLSFVNFDDDVSLKGYLYFVAGLDNLFNNL